MLLNKITKVLLLSIVMLSSLSARPGGDHTLGEINPNLTTIATLPSEVPADGVSTSSVSIYLEDYNGTAISNATIELVSENINDTTVGSMVNHNNGTYTFSIKSNVVEIVKFKANISAIDLEGVLHTDATDYVSIYFIPPVLPYGVRIDAGEVKYITSVYDQDYAPYTRQLGSGTYDRPVDADGLNDGTTIDIQGVLSTAGESVELKYHSYVDTYIPAYKAAYNVPSEHTEDGQARRVVLSYPAQSLHSGNGVVHATIKSEVANLNAKKLDINAGIGDGSDRIMINASNNLSKSVYGAMLANFDMAVNSNGDIGEVQLRIMVGIPDRRFGETGHNFLYLPKQSSGKTWLNNNLEADYANLDNPHFNLAKQATNKLDSHAFGSYFETTTSSDICPRGYKLPLDSDLDRERYSWGYYNRSANGAYASPLKLTAAGHWNTLAWEGYKRQYVGWGRYLSSSKHSYCSGYTNTLVYHSCAANMQYLSDHCVKYLKFSARCVKK